MKFNIEFGRIADAYGNVPGVWNLMFEGIPQLARNHGIELDTEKSRWETHAGGKRGGSCYVRYVAVAPANADKEKWEVQIRELQTYIRIRLRNNRNATKRS